jgi:hypothetical protein
VNYASCISLAAIAASIGFAPVASANTIAHFEAGNGSPHGVMSFDIPLTPHITSFTDVSFEIDDVVTTLFDPDLGSFSKTVDYTFHVYDPENFESGGYDADGLYYTDGPQLFSGPTSSPTFLPGSYPLIEFDARGENDNFGVRITTYAAAVPESTTWAMLIVGFSAIGVGLRKDRSRQRVRLAYASADDEDSDHAATAA